MIGAVLLNLWLSLVDVVRAGVHIVLRSRRNVYTTRTTIAAPRSYVWDLLVRPHVKYEATGLQSVQRPLEGVRDAYIGEISVAGRPVASIGCQYVERRAPDLLKLRYLREHTNKPRGIGDDDIVAFELAEAPDDSTCLTIRRELTHLIAATRISAPLGTRQAGYLIKTQAERESGRGKKPAGLWQQSLWSLVAVASFVLLFGIEDGLVLTAIIVVHEVGHALAMLRYGLGLRLISLIPLFGGFAMPRRYYHNEWQRGIVALMGVGLCLPFTAALAWLGDSDDFELATKAAQMSVFVNGFNLLPIPGLDGAAITQILLRRLPAVVGRAVGIAALIGFVALAVLLNEPVVWIGVAFSAIVLVQTAALRTDTTLPQASWPATAGLLVLFIATIAAYVLIGVKVIT